jgi:predicted aldo/keto reductase-like oxidoreductase
MKNQSNNSRRNFLKASAILPVAAVATFSPRSQAEESPTSPASEALQTRKLGANGPAVSILNLGGMMSAHSPQYLDLAWNMGIRYFDTADCYIKGKSENNVAAWLKRYPERRKDLFLVTKDHPKDGPEQLFEMVDRRLEACGTDYIDLFLIHGIGAGGYGEDSLNWPKSQQLKDVFDQLKASGKVKHCGFSCHDGRLVDYLNAAAAGGFVDAILLKYNPFHQKGGDFDRALDACYEAGIGLISMKEMKPFAKAPKKHPTLDEVGLTTHQSLLHAVWSDPRIASICSSMDNVMHLEENTQAARLFKGALPGAQREALQQVAMRMPVPMCPGCPGCEQWAHRTEYAFQDISRYLTYYEQDGRSEAGDFYQQLDAAQKYADVDLSAIRQDCQFKVDYPEIARRAEQYFA